MKITRSILLIAMILAPLTGRVLTAAAEPTPTLAGPAADTQRVALHVEGMTCGGCAISTRAVLNRLEGVRRVEVSYERKRALVTYDPSKVTPRRMIAALKEKFGYTARVVRMGGR